MGHPRGYMYGCVYVKSKDNGSHISKGLLKNLGTPTIIKKQGLLENSQLYKNMNWKRHIIEAVTGKVAAPTFRKTNLRNNDNTPKVAHKVGMDLGDVKKTVRTIHSQPARNPRTIKTKPEETMPSERPKPKFTTVTAEGSMYNNMNWKDRLKALVLETYK